MSKVNPRYSHVGMTDNPTSSRSGASNRRRGPVNNVTEFPNPFGSAWDAGLTIIFELDDRRLANDGNVTELNQKPAEVIPIRKKRQGKSRSRPREL